MLIFHFKKMTVANFGRILRKYRMVKVHVFLLFISHIIVDDFDRNLVSRQFIEFFKINFDLKYIYEFSSKKSRFSEGVMLVKVQFFSQ